MSLIRHPKPLLLIFACWAYTRRKFVKAVEANGPAAERYVAEIQRHYRIEAEARKGEIDGASRAQLRAQRSAPALATIKERVDADSVEGKLLTYTLLAKAISYTMAIWPGLTRCAQAGNAAVEWY